MIEDKKSISVFIPAKNENRLWSMAMMFIALTKVGFVKIVPPGTIDVSFDDVYGQDRARDRVREQVLLLENDEEIEAVIAQVLHVESPSVARAFELKELDVESKTGCVPVARVTVV
ncbi:hypothetical protein LCGC14_2003390, partial [marine sediment metagenome]